MGREYPPYRVFEAEDLYVLDGHTLDEVSELTEIPQATIYRWSVKYEWVEKRTEIRQAESDRRMDQVRLRAKLVNLALNADAPKPLDIFAVAKLEEVALAAQKLALEESQVKNVEAVGVPAISTPEQAKNALYEAVVGKIAVMLTDPSKLDLKSLKDLRGALDYLQPAEDKTTRKGISKETAQEIIDKVLGG